MRSHISLFVLIILASGYAALSGAPTTPSVYLPAIGLPAFIPAGESFQVMVVGPRTYSAGEVTLTALGHFAEPALTVESAIAVNESTTTLEVLTQAGLPIGKYDLSGTVDSHPFTKSGALSIWDSLETNFRILHITDIHSGTSGYDSWRARAIAEINLVHPLFILATGDLADNGSNESQAIEIAAFLREIEAPVFCIPGNHDDNMLGIPYYRRWIAPITDYSFALGPALVMMFDTGPDSGMFSRCYGIRTDQLVWLNSVMAYDTHPIRIIGGHGPFYDELTPNRHGISQFHDLCQSYGISHYLCGHTHIAKLFDADGHRVEGNLPNLAMHHIETNSLSQTDVITLTIPSIRVLRVAGDSLIRCSVDSNANGVDDAATPFRLAQVTISLTNTDDGSSNHQQVTIQSTLNDSIEDPRVYLHMAPADTYRVTGGRLVHQNSLTGFIEFAPVTLSPNMTRIVVINGQPLSVSHSISESDDDFRALINSTAGSIRIIFPEVRDNSTVLNVFDGLGRNFRSFALQPGAREATLSDLPSGFWLLKLTTPEAQRTIHLAW